VLTIPEALHIATRDSARVLRLESEIGAVQPGYLADIILVDLSGLHHQPLYNVGASLVYNTRASDVQTVIINGQVVMRDRQLLTLDKAEILAEVKARAPRLSRRGDQRIQTYQP
jgi:5-methylthioadenosine/S-adenosylhomocysteine deaminase